MRTKRGQALHDKSLASWANRLRGPGKQVFVALPDQPQPPSLGRKIPDLVVKQGGKIKVIGEVETVGTVNTDKSQQKTFRDAAKKLGADFRLKLAKEKRG